MLYPPWGYFSLLHQGAGCCKTLQNAMFRILGCGHCVPVQAPIFNAPGGRIRNVLVTEDDVMLPGAVAPWVSNGAC